MKNLLNEIETSGMKCRRLPEGEAEMKKTSTLAAVLVSVLMVLAAGAAKADDIYTFPIFTQVGAGSGVTSNTAATWTNAVAERVLLKSLWLTGPTLTNGTMKLVQPIATNTTQTTTNDLAVTMLGSTLYCVPVVDSLWIEAAGSIQWTGLSSASNASSRFSVYGARPGR